MGKSKLRHEGRLLLRRAWRRSTPGLIAVVFFGSMHNLLKFAVPLYLLQVLDRIPASRSVESLIMLTAITLVAVITSVTLDIIRKRALIRWAAWIEAFFAPNIVDDALSPGGLDEPVATRGKLDDLTTLRNFVSNGLVNWLDVWWSPIFLLAAWLIDPFIAAIATVGLVVVLILSIIGDRMTSDVRIASRDSRRDASALVRTADRNRESFYALGLRDAVFGRWQNAMHSGIDERELADGRTATVRAITSGTGIILKVVILGVGMWLFLLGELTLGAVFAVRVVCGHSFNSFERAARTWRSLRIASESYMRLRSGLVRKSSTEAAFKPSLDGVPLVLSRLGHRYKNQPISVFRRISLELQPGEMLLVNGVAGTGKSTLSRIIGGLVKPRYGEARLGDLALFRLPKSDRADLIGYVSQHTELFDGTIAENISRLYESDEDEVIRAAKLIGLHELIVSLPQGYDTVIGPDTISTLSGSARKRIAIARAIYPRPKLLVLDEPSANLDRKSRVSLVRALRELKGDGTLIVVTQVVNSARMSRVADYELFLGDKVELKAADAEKSRANAPNLRSVS